VLTGIRLEASLSSEIGNGVLQWSNQAGASGIWLLGLTPNGREQVIPARNY